jgi:hypothetical protein
MLLEKDISITEEYKTKDRLTIFVGSKMSTCTEHISRVPESVFEVFEFYICH